MTTTINPPPASDIDTIVGRWLATLSQHAALPAPAGGPEDTDMQTSLDTLPVNSAGESWPDAIRAYGQRYNNTPQQISQAIDRAQALVAGGDSPAKAIETVRATLSRWSQIRADDDTFNARKPQLARGCRFWLERA